MMMTTTTTTEGKLCTGLRVDGKPCTRQKKRGCDFCGIHVPSERPPVGGLSATLIPTKDTASPEPSTPIPTKDTANVSKGGRKGVHIEKNTTDKHVMELTAKEIRGIIYYVDTNQNVYNIEDILDEKVDPRIIGKLISTEQQTVFEEIAPEGGQLLRYTS